METDLRIIKGQLCEVFIDVDLVSGKKRRNVKPLGQPITRYDTKECDQLFEYIIQLLRHIGVDVVPSPSNTIGLEFFSYPMNDNILDCISHIVAKTNGNKITIRNTGPMLHYNLFDSEGNIITSNKEKKCSPPFWADYLP